MASSLPSDQQGSASHARSSSAEQDNGPLSNLNLGFLKGLTEKKATRGTFRFGRYVLFRY